MRTIARLAAGAIAMLGLAAVSAEAMPIAPPAALATESGFVQVRDGCGPYGRRSRSGYCRPGGYGFGGPALYGRPGFYGPPRAYGRPRPDYGRRCFIRETYYGPRRVCR